MSTTELPDLDVPADEASVPAGDTQVAPAQPRPRRRAVIALTVVNVVLLISGAVLGGLLVGARSDAAELAVAEAAEERAHQDAIASLVGERSSLESQIEDAEAGALSAQRRIDAAEAAQQAAADRVAAREQAAAEAVAADEQSFADLVRDDMPGVPDAELVARGRDVCSFLDSNGGDVYAAMDRAEVTYGIDVAISLVAASVTLLCPEYD